ncbi:MAG: hypothetical protein GAK28_01617 [Luteibacter sp.]|uniref:hypothetical protein n=1 Tax=Luteibacter sp. TaxID=1886636 RepID=UPI0013865A4E|nr:hypothetical protein [Luteibacter sp.]KAF1007660.1 MAG: hypothetical protein GAK28_01617 [Luteibacter sp.]
MKVLTDSSLFDQWISRTGNIPEKPFEHVAAIDYRNFMAFGYTEIFLVDVIDAIRSMADDEDAEEICYLFTAPDPRSYFDETGFFGAVTFRPDEPSSDIEEALYAPRRGLEVYSIYETSHRTYVLPSRGSWMIVADRDADLALLCFRSAEDLQRFRLLSPTLEGFDTLADAATHARSFMDYDLDLGALS